MQNALPDSAGKRYVKRPVVIEAMQLTPETGRELYEWVESHIGSVDPDSADLGITIDPADGAFVIRTLEGDMKVGPGWWVIKGVDGEFYPCRDDIFLKTYAPDDGSGILVIPPGLMENIVSANYDVTGIHSRQTTVSTDVRLNPWTSREELVVHVDHRVEITAERKRG
jgi:hypothetical protein